MEEKQLSAKPPDEQQHGGDVPLHTQKQVSIFHSIEPCVGPFLITAASAYVRLKDITKADRVIWDEAHFGKFGAYYLLHEFYFDVHPPLGKLLIGLSGYLANFNGSYLFESGEYYPSHVDYGTMRVFNSVFGILCSPVTYYTCKALGFNLWTVYLVSLMVVFENSFVVLSKFILLDSMLLFFTATTFLCLAQLHRVSRIQQKGNHELSKQWLLWLILTGISIGCVCSVKWVGFFATVVVGIYTIYDLFTKFIDDKMSRQTYFKHWVLRIINLVVLPVIIYVLTFRVHFLVLYKAGTGHSSMPSLFQVNLENHDIEASPRNIAYGSRVTMRSHGLSPNLLHSHVQGYPQGSRQRQVTTYGHKDTNNDWVFAPSRLSKQPRFNPNISTSIEYVKSGDRVRLYHANLNVNLHSHRVPGHMTKNTYEVSGYGSEEIGDIKDDWVVEIVKQIPLPPKLNNNNTANSTNFEDTNLIHPLSTNFRLRHAEIGCYLATTGASYPAWGFKQGEVVCKQSIFKNDKATWWNVEDHSHDNLTVDYDFVAPQSNFWNDFILLNFAMLGSNNALVPDLDKHDTLASQWWQWPLLQVGLRMSSWNSLDKKYYMMANPFIIWITTLNIVILIIIVGYKIFLWQCQAINYNDVQFHKFLSQSLLPLLGWVLHYLPFAVMGRVTYVHHYLPAEYFAIFVAGSNVDRFVAKFGKVWFTVVVYGILYGLVIGVFQYFSPLTYGAEGSIYDYEYLKWFESWNIC